MIEDMAIARSSTVKTDLEERQRAGRSSSKQDGC